MARTTNYKSFRTLTQAAERLIAELDAATIESMEDDQYYNERHANIDRQLGSLWANPAETTEAVVLRGRLMDALYRAQNRPARAAK